MALQSGIEGFAVAFEQFMRNDALFIIRIKSNWKWDENYRIATRYGPVRVVCFGSVEQKVDDYLATNIPEAVMSHEERAAAYRRACYRSFSRRKLDQMMSKNLHGITMQI
jgi:hypothetical protein